MRCSIRWRAIIALPVGDSDAAGVAWCDLSTGRFFAAVVPLARLNDEIARIGPVECLLADDAEFKLHLPAKSILTKRPTWAFAHDTGVNSLARHFQTFSLDGFGFTDEDTPALRAAGAVLDYLQETQKTNLQHIDRLLPYRSGQSLEIDEATRRSLELTRTLRTGSRAGSLLAAIDKTCTPMGGRLLADWLASPLTDLEQIEGRLNAVAELAKDSALRDELREQLRGVYDLQRLLARVATGRASPRDLSFVGRTLAALPKLKAKLTARTAKLLGELEQAIDLCPEIRAQLESALVDDCPLQPRDGGIIRGGYHSNLDKLRDLAAGGKQWIAKYQADEAARTGIPNLKVAFNKVFGYYIEITNSHKDKTPPNYHRKQTTTNSERYVTPELKEYEEQVLSADDKAKELEYEIFLKLRDAVQAMTRRLQATAAALAQLDVLTSLAQLACQRNYCRPAMTNEPELRIVDGRHPVLDVIETQGSFVPNDAHCGGDDGFVLLITGPNMAGKSTYIRQVALLTVMAQIGSFVPAKMATIGIADRVFARVGASDELSRGQSTFMVEMTETARILNTATTRSLVVLDEIGRGTSTYDGISLAWAIVEHLHDTVGCRTFFATHYHELTDLAGTMAGVRNLNVAVKEWEEQVIFLHKILPGAADKSYGIHVARLAGVPRSVNERAKQILAQLEQDHVGSNGQSKLVKPKTKRKGDLQLTLFAPEEHPLIEKIRQLDTNELSPMAALKLLSEWQAEIAPGKVKPR